MIHNNMYMLYMLLNFVYPPSSLSFAVYSPSLYSRYFLYSLYSLYSPSPISLSLCLPLSQVVHVCMALLFWQGAAPCTPAYSIRQSESFRYPPSTSIIYATRHLRRNGSRVMSEARPSSKKGESERLGRYERSGACGIRMMSHRGEKRDGERGSEGKPEASILRHWCRLRGGDPVKQKIPRSYRHFYINTEILLILGARGL